VRAAIVTRPIEAAALVLEVGNIAHGAIILFLGTVRDMNDGRAVSGIEYRAYDAMAQLELQRIVAEAADRFDTQEIVVEHRVGELALGEVSVGIAVSHEHRDPAYAASRFVIEELKRRVPVWKKEEYGDGTREWVDPTRAGAEAAK
jgi:molybdopterin synthase catalytic subunit